MEGNKLQTIPAASSAPDLVEVRANSAKFPRLWQIPREQAVAQLTPCILQAFMYRGQNADGTLVEFTAGNLIDELLADADGVGLRGLTLYEITRCVKRAVLGQSGRELYGVNVSSLYATLVDYAKGEGHQADVKALQAAKRETCRPVQALLDSYTGAMLKNIKSRK